MTFTLEKLKEARDAGISDDVIWEAAGQSNPKFSDLKKNNIPLDVAFEAMQAAQPAQPAETEPDRRAGGGVVGGAADVGVQFMKGLGTGTRMISDVFGANNPVSQAIAGYEDYFDDLLSAESKQDSQEISRILKDAEGKGILPQILAGLEAFTVAPAEMTASTLGMMLPNLAGGVYAKAAQLGKAGVLGLQMGIGAAQGTGSVKGQIYTAVQEELRQQGLPEDQIDKVATEAQAYGGKNLDQILIGAGLGAAASSTGAEKIMTRLITGSGKEASEGVIKSMVKGGVTEAPIEGLQGGQEQVAQNVALQRIGVDVPTMQGVIPAATMEATAGLVVGGGFGGVSAIVSPEVQKERDIDKKSDQESNELLAPNNPASQAVVKELARRENAVTNLQQAYDSLEPNSQEAQRLNLELSEAQRNLSAFKETANKEGLSLPITDAEAEQARLAREIAAPPAAITPAPTVTPAPVSETITEAEKQQTELAKAITAPEAAVPTEQVAQPIEEAAAQPIEIPTPVETTTPALVTEQAAPAEAPAAEPAGIAIGNRVKTKTTPQSFVVEEVLPQSEREVELGEKYYRIKNERTGEMQTVEAKDINPIKAPKATKKMAPIRVKEKATPVPEAERYTFDEAGIRAINFFGGKAPKGLIIVNDTADPNYEMKAGYEPETGDIIVNRAYIKKGESIEDILTHELGHYIFSDPKFQADFKNFLASMPDDTRAQIEAIINQSYNKDTNQTQIEERQVMAFTALVKANKDTLSKWENFKNTIKRWINKVLRTNIKLSDEGAMAVFNVGFKRFKSGEKIVRAMEEGILKMAAEPAKPAEEGKPAMERYDKKSQVGGVPGIGAAIDTPKQINAKTETIIKESVFNSDIVNDNQTKKAWNLIQQLDSANPEAGKNAEAINQLTRETMQDVEAEDIVKQTIGAAKLRNELYKYAMKLTAEGDKKMLDYLLNNRLALAGGAITEGDAGRLLQSLASLKNWIVVATEAEREGFFQMGAQQFFNTKNPTDEQIAQIRDMFNKVKQVKIDQVQALGGELGKVGQATGIDLPAVIDKQLENAPGLDPMIVAIQNLLRMGGTFIYRQFPSKVEQAVKQTISRGITNYRQKMVSKAATGLETGFWKTLSTKEDKPGRLGELDAAQNRELGNIVKSTLVGMGLKGEPPNTKMSIYEQVASILNEQPLKADKIKMADEKIRSGITAKRVAELENARSEGEVDAINHKYDQLESAWDEAMSRQTDMPVSNAMLRRMIFAELKEEKSSMTDLAKQMEEEPAIAISRMDRLVNSIIEKVTGITFDGQPTRDYTSLKTYLDGMLSDLVEKRQTDRRAASEQSKIKRQAGGDPTKQAQAQIDKLAKIQADPTIFGETKIDPVRNAVRDALSLQLNIGFTPAQTAEIKTNWKGAYVADPNQMGIPTSFMLEMQRLGVKEDAANTLAEIVWKQIEVNAMNRQMDSLTKAVEAGPIGGMVQAILDTPLANQQDPEWRKQVIVDYLTNAGVKPSQAENIARLFDLSLRKRFAEAQEAAMDKAAKAIKGGLDPASKKAMDKFRKAIRAQVLDPGTDVAKAFGEQMGWTGFTKEQIVRLNELDAIVNDTTKTEAETFVAIEQINKIIDSVSLPPQIKDILASYYVGNILGRITTFTIQAIDPLFFTGFNAVIESFKNITNPAQFMSVWSNYGRGIANLVRETSFSFKNDVLRSGKLVDYMGRQDRQIGRLLNEAQKKWQRGDIKGAMKDGIFGYTALTFRTLKALDDGAYSLLTTTTLPSYVDAALKRAKVPANKRRGVMRQILEARELDIKKMVDQGTPRNDAIVFANEKMRGEITKVLTGMNIDAQEVIDSAINDSLSRLGKTRFQEDIHGKETEIKDLGFISSPLLRFYEAVARSVNEKGGSESQKIFYRILLGFPLIPARIFNIAAGYTPLTIYRHALKSRYSLTYGTALQRRQRFVEQLAGTAAMLPLLLLRSNSLDEEDEEKKGFGIYITGQGPSRTMDKETRAQWDKRFDPYSAVMRVPGVGSFSIDARSSGPLAVMIYTFGAIDDWENRRKQEGLKTGKDDWRDVHEKASLFTAMYELAGSFALTTARRGPTTGVIQGLVDFRSYPDDPIAAIGKEVAFSGMPAVPILGTGIAKNLSDFFSQPIDNKTKEGAMLSNIPIVGPVVGKPALNAYGQRIGELRVSEKLKKSFGIPFTLIVGDKEEDMKLTSLTLKFGNGPTPIRRAEIEDAIKDVLSDEEWYLAAKTFGDRNSEKVLAGYERYNKMKPDRFNDAMNRITTESKRAAIRAVRLKKSENR
jgi:hypothetical protein